MINVNQFQKMSLPGLFSGQLMQLTNDSKNVSKYQSQQQLSVTTVTSSVNISNSQ